MVTSHLNFLQYQLPSVCSNEFLNFFPSLYAYEAIEQTNPLQPDACVSGPSERSVLQWLFDKCAQIKLEHWTQENLFREVIRATELDGAMDDLAADMLLQQRLFELVGTCNNGFEFMGDVIARADDIKKAHITAKDVDQFLERTHAETSVDNVKDNTLTAKGKRQKSSKQRSGQRSSDVTAAEASLLASLEEYPEEFLSTSQSGVAHLSSIQDPTAWVAELARQYGGAGGGGGRGDAVGKRGLPSNAVRKTERGYELVHVPAPVKSRKVVDKASLVPIASLDKWAQVAFPDTEHLNAIQSAVYASAFHSSENLLVCAPTGAGKTNIAMLTLLQLARGWVNEATGVINRRGFKAVYIAPMKALAQEVNRWIIQSRGFMPYFVFVCHAGDACCCC